MIITRKHLGAAIACLALGHFVAMQCPAPVYAQDAKQLVEQVVTTELTAGQADQSHWLYFEVDRKPNAQVEQWVAETPKCDLRRVLAENNRQFSDTQQRQKMDAFLRDTGAQAQQRKKQQDDIRQTVDLLKLLPQAFLWTTTGSHGDETTLHFKPDPHFHPPNREAKILSGVEGDLELNAAQHRIVSLKGKLVHDVKFGGGLLGDLKAGGGFDIERREISQGEWQITETHVHFEGRMLLFKSISEQEDDEKSKFKQLPAALSVDQAETELMHEGDVATK
jgi:hypothetical protein